MILRWVFFGGGENEVNFKAGEKKDQNHKYLLSTSLSKHEKVALYLHFAMVWKHVALGIQRIPTDNLFFFYLQNPIWLETKILENSWLRSCILHVHVVFGFFLCAVEYAESVWIDRIDAV